MCGMSISVDNMMFVTDDSSVAELPSSDKSQYEEGSQESVSGQGSPVSLKYDLSAPPEGLSERSSPALFWTDILELYESWFRRLSFPVFFYSTEAASMFQNLRRQYVGPLSKALTDSRFASDDDLSHGTGDTDYPAPSHYYLSGMTTKPNSDSPVFDWPPFSQTEGPASTLLMRLVSGVIDLYVGGTVVGSPVANRTKFYFLDPDGEIPSRGVCWQTSPSYVAAGRRIDTTDSSMSNITSDGTGYDVVDKKKVARASDVVKVTRMDASAPFPFATVADRIGLETKVSTVSVGRHGVRIPDRRVDFMEGGVEKIPLDAKVCGAEERYFASKDWHDPWSYGPLVFRWPEGVEESGAVKDGDEGPVCVNAYSPLVEMETMRFPRTAMSPASEGGTFHDFRLPEEVERPVADEEEGGSSESPLSQDGSSDEEPEEWKYALPVVDMLKLAYEANGSYVCAEPGASVSTVKFMPPEGPKGNADDEYGKVCKLTYEVCPGIVSHDDVPEPLDPDEAVSRFGELVKASPQSGEKDYVDDSVEELMKHCPYPSPWGVLPYLWCTDPETGGLFTGYVSSKSLNRSRWSEESGVDCLAFVSKVDKDGETPADYRYAYAGQVPPVMQGLTLKSLAKLRSGLTRVLVPVDVASVLAKVDLDYDCSTTFTTTKKVSGQKTSRESCTYSGYPQDDPDSPKSYSVEGTVDYSKPDEVTEERAATTVRTTGWFRLDGFPDGTPTVRVHGLSGSAVVGFSRNADLGTGYRETSHEAKTVEDGDGKKHKVTVDRVTVTQSQKDETTTVKAGTSGSCSTYMTAFRICPGALKSYESSTTTAVTRTDGTFDTSDKVISSADVPDSLLDSDVMDRFVKRAVLYATVEFSASLTGPVSQYAESRTVISTSFESTQRPELPLAYSGSKIDMSESVELDGQSGCRAVQRKVIALGTLGRHGVFSGATFVPEQHVDELVKSMPETQFNSSVRDIVLDKTSFAFSAAYNGTSRSLSYSGFETMSFGNTVRHSESGEESRSDGSDNEETTMVVGTVRPDGTAHAKATATWRVLETFIVADFDFDKDDSV